MEELESVPEYKVYSKNQVGVATFIGAPIAGAILMSQNAKALNQPEKVKQYLLIGLVSTIVLFIIAFLLPDNFPGLA